MPVLDYLKKVLNLSTLLYRVDGSEPHCVLNGLWPGQCESMRPEDKTMEGGRGSGGGKEGRREGGD